MTFTPNDIRRIDAAATRWARDKMKPAIIDALRQELRRQAKYNHDLKLTTLATDKPDTIRVVGRLDLYELAKAIENR